MTKHLLWIQGWGTSRHVWDDVETDLPEYEHHNVSFAQSDTVESMIQTITDKLATRTNGWTLVGWSMGGMLALDVAFDANLRTSLGIQAIVLVSTTLQFVDFERNKGWPKRMVQRMSSQLSLNREETLDRFKQLMLSHSDIDMNQTNPNNSNHQNKLRTQLETEFSSIGLQAGLNYLMEHSLKQNWQQFVQQTNRLEWLWIHGDEDAICPIGCLPERSDQRIVIIHQAGHLPFLTHKQQFYQHLRSFLNAHE